MSQVVLLIRHGQTDFHPQRLAAWTPGVHLSEAGRGEADALAQRLSGVRLVAAYSSPLERCRETAAAVLEGRDLELRIEEDVGEVKFGSWQGRPYKVLAKTKIWRKVQHVPSQAAFPDGESIRDLQRRSVEAIERIRTDHRRGIVAVFSHADTIKVMTAHYLGMHLDMFQRLVIPTASVTAIWFGDAFPRVLRVGDTGRYDELVPRRPSPKPKPATAARR